MKNYIEQLVGDLVLDKTSRQGIVFEITSRSIRCYYDLVKGNSKYFINVRPCSEVLRICK